MKKILIVIPSLTKGGAERVASGLANSLSGKGYDVTLAALRLEKSAYTLINNVQVISLCRGNSANNPFSRLRFAFFTFINFWALLKKKNPDFIISFTTTSNTWTGILGSIFRVPYVVSERTTPDRTIHKLPPLLKKMVFKLYKHSKAIVVPSEGIVHNLKKSEQFAGLSNIIIINNPITEFKDVLSEKVHHRPFILSVGRLHKIKGFDRLIKAFKQLNNPDIDLLIVGEGTERENLVSLINELGLKEQVFLPGIKDNVQDYYKQCLLYVLSSRNEGYPNALVEAMSLGCACVAFDCEYGPSEIIRHGENGLLVPDNDISLLAGAIGMLVKDDQLRAEFSKNAKAVKESNSVAAITSKWESLIQESA